MKLLCGPGPRLIGKMVRTFGQPVMDKKQITKQSMGMKENEIPGHGGLILAQASGLHKARDRRS